MRHTHFHDAVPDPGDTRSASPPGAVTALTTGLAVAGSRVDDANARVSVEGVLDLATVHLLTSVLDGQLRLGRRHVRVDLSRATVADVGCLRQLRAVNDRFRVAHGRLVLDPVTDDLRSSLRIVGLDRELVTMPPVSPSEHVTSAVRTLPT